MLKDEIKPFDDLWKLLNKPQVIDQTTFISLFWWMHPKNVSTDQISQICIDGGALRSISEVRQKIKENSLFWNGEKITCHNQLVKFLWPGWGIIRIGKKQHIMVTKGFPVH